MGYIDELEAEKSLQKFAKGDTFSLFKLVLQSVYEPRELLKDSSFIISMLKNPLTGENKKDFLQLLIDKHIDFSTEYSETDPEELKKFNDYWKNTIPQPAPLLFSIIPYINDEQLELIAKEGYLYKLGDSPNINIFGESLILNLFEKGYANSIVALKDNYYTLFSELKLYDKKLYPGQTEEKTLEEIFEAYSDEKPSLLYPLTRMSWCGLDSLADRWLVKQLDKPRKDNIVIQEFFDTFYNRLSDSGKEAIIARTLYKTNDLDFTMIALNKIGITDLSQYKPTTYPIWSGAIEHKNKSIYRKFIRNGANVFDYYKGGNKTFLSIILDGISEGGGSYNKKKLSEILEEQKVDYKTFIKELLEKKIDENGVEYTNFSFLMSLNDSTIINHLNLKLEDVANYSKKFSPEKWEKLKLKEKIELLNDVLDRTLLADAYPVDSFYKKHIERMGINLNLYLNDQYYPRYEIPLIDEHLKLLAQVSPENYDCRDKYFKIVSKMFDLYPAGRFESSTPIYNLYFKMIDYVATDKSLDWAGLTEFLSSEKVTKHKNEYCEGSLDLYNYLQKVCLSHTLKPSNGHDKKKIKI